MSERVRNTVKASLPGSKKIIVAACAAIAMFLGAVSAGASMLGQGDSAKNPPIMSSMFQTPSPDNTKRAATEDRTSPVLTQQHPFGTGNVILQSSPLYDAPTNGVINIPKINVVGEVLKSMGNTVIFQNPTEVLEKLQGNTLDSLSNTLAPATTSLTPVTDVLVPSSSSETASPVLSQDKTATGSTQDSETNQPQGGDAGTEAQSTTSANPSTPIQ
ncbi:MAG TPA: hypothetical protein VF733_02135 [Candidatus Saccharimonadales bacterium]